MATVRARAVLVLNASISIERAAKSTLRQRNFSNSPRRIAVSTSAMRIGRRCLRESTSQAANSFFSSSNVINRSRCVSSALLINEAPLLKGFFEIQSCRSAKLRIARRISSSRLTEAMLLVVPRTVRTFSLASLNASMSECVMARIRRSPKCSTKISTANRAGASERTPAILRSNRLMSRCLKTLLRYSQQRIPACLIEDRNSLCHLFSRPFQPIVERFAAHSQPMSHRRMTYQMGPLLFINR